MKLNNRNIVSNSYYFFFKVRHQPAILFCLLSLSSPCLNQFLPNVKTLIVDIRRLNQPSPLKTFIWPFMVNPSLFRLRSPLLFCLRVCFPCKKATENLLWANLRYLSHGMGFPTMCYMRPAKPQTSLRICAV